MRKIFFALLGLFYGISSMAQSQFGEIRGTIKDGKNGNPIEMGTVILEMSGVKKGLTKTNQSGFFNFKGIDPGEYTIKFVLFGYEKLEFTGVSVSPGEITTVDLSPDPTVNELTIFTKKEYKNPIISPDGVNGQNFSSKNLKNLPTRNINQIVNLSGKVNSFNGGTPTFGGARPDATAYYVDGIRVTGSFGVPRSAIDQIQVIVGGVPAMYGDYTGGAISITTKGPSRFKQGGIEMISSSMFDKFHYNHLEWFFQGPLYIKNKKTEKEKVVIGYSLGGNYIFSADPSPYYSDLWKVKDSKLTELRNHPLQPAPNGIGFVNSAEFVTFSDMEKIPAKLNAQSHNVALVGNLSFALSDKISLAMGGTFNYSNGIGYNFGSSLFNYENNGKGIGSTLRVFARMTHYLKKQSDNTKDKDDKSLISNAFYTIRVDYTSVYNLSEDAVHQDRIFDYGYLGKYTTYRAPAYGYKGNPNNPNQKPTQFNTKSPFTGNDTSVYLTNYFEQTGFRDTLVTFNPGTLNTVRQNYTKDFYSFMDGYGAPVRNLDMIRQGLGLLNGDAPNSVYSMWTNVGTPGSGYGKSQTEQYTVFAMGEVSIQNKKDKTRQHDVQFGLQYEQRISRSYSVATTGMWTLMRQLAQKDAAKIDRLNPILTWDANGVFQDTVKYNAVVDHASESQFTRKLREHLKSTGALDANGKPINDNSTLDVDNYSPDNYNINYFSPDELLNNGSAYVNYFGYDYLGNKVKGKPSLDAFLNDPSKRTIGAFSPVYTAAFIQDKFAFKDLIMRIGLRVDRYDANQYVLKDPYSLYPVKTVGEVRNDPNNPLGSQIKSTVGEDYIVYVNDVTNPTSVLGYRNTESNGLTRWYNKEGNTVNDPSQLANQTANGRISPLLVDPKNQKLTSNSFVDYQPKLYFLPRIWFKFPISTSAQFFANYDVLTQRPPQGSVTTIDDYYFLNARATETLNNPNLRPTRRTDYEIGFKQQIGDRAGLSLIASYSEMRDMIQLFRFNQAYPLSYTTFANVDFGTVKGFRVEYELRDAGPKENIQFFANYMLQFADGTGSNAGSQGALIAAGQPNLRTLFPLDFDVRHVIKGNFDFHFKDKDGPVWNKKHPLQNAGMNFIFNARSGLPYTQTSQPQNSAQGGIVQRAQIKGSPNGSRLPWQFTLDATIDKTFILKRSSKEDLDQKPPVGINVYLWVQNVLNAQNIVGVYQYTGSAKDDGYLSSPLGQQRAADQLNAQSFMDLYTARVQFPGNYATPRLIRLGVRFNF